MKHTLLVTFFLITTFCYSQERLHIGIKVNPELSSFYPGFSYKSSTTDRKQQPKLCLGGGITVVKYFNRHLGIETGVHYFNRGWTLILKSSGNTKAYTLFSTYNYNYISIPLLGRIKAKGFYLSSGLSFDYCFLFYQKKVISFTDQKAYDYFFNVKEYGLNRFNISLMGNTGYEMQWSEKIKTGIEIRYNSGLRNIYPKSDNSKFNNLGLGFTALYSI